MERNYAEAAFDTLLVLVVVTGFGSYTLGVIIDPLLVVVPSIVAVAVGAALLAPIGNRFIACLVGIVAVFLGGFLFPRFAGLVVGALLTGVVLLAVFVTLRATVFSIERTAAAN